MSVSELSRSRPAAEPENQPGASGSLIAKLRSWPGRLASSAVTRVVFIFAAGFAAGMAWQSYGNVARKAVAGWSPHLAWVAPPSAGTAADRLRATSLALTSVQKSVDKLSDEIDKLQADDNAPRRRRR